MPVQDNATALSLSVAKEFGPTVKDACLTLVPKGIAHHHHYSHPNQENGCMNTTEIPAASAQQSSCPNLPLAESQVQRSSTGSQHNLPVVAEKLPMEQTSSNRQKKNIKKTSKKQPKGSVGKNLHPMQSYQHSDYSQYPLLSDAGRSSMETRGYIPMNPYPLPSSGLYELTNMNLPTPFGTYSEGYPSTLHTSPSLHNLPQHPSKTRTSKRRSSVPREINARKEGIETPMRAYVPGPHPSHMNCAYPMPLISSPVASAVPSGNTTLDISPALPQPHLPLNSSPNIPMHTSTAISSSPPKSPEITRYTGHNRNVGTKTRNTNQRFLKDQVRPTVPTREAEECLTIQMERLYEHLIPSAESQAQRYRFVSKIQSICDREWPGKGIVAHLFGSSANDLGTANSDVDICLLTSWNGFVNIYIMAAVLKKYGMERVACIGGAKVPIVKFWDSEFQLACDMNVNTPISLVNTRLVKTYVAIDPRVRPFIMCVKHWTKKRALNDAAAGGTLSSYTWVCLLINFLQMRQPPILPCLHRLERERRRKSKAGQPSDTTAEGSEGHVHMNGAKGVNGFHVPNKCNGTGDGSNGYPLGSTSQHPIGNASSHEKEEIRNGAPVDVNNSTCTTLVMSEGAPVRNWGPVMQIYGSDEEENAGEQFLDDLEDPLIKNFGNANHETLGGLLFAFFQRYARDFDYDKFVVSVRHGTYLNKAEKGWNPGGHNLGPGRPYRRFAIEEPMDTQRNLGNSADDVSVYGLRKEFRRALNILWDSCDFNAVCMEYNYPQIVNANKAGPEKYRRPRALSMPNSGYLNEYEYYSHSIPTPAIAGKLGAAAGGAASPAVPGGQFYGPMPILNPSGSGHVQGISCGSVGSRGSSVHAVNKGGGFASTPTSPKMDSPGLPYDCMYGGKAVNPRWDGMVTSSSTTSTTGDDESEIRDNGNGTKTEAPGKCGTLPHEGHTSPDTGEVPLRSSPKNDPFVIATEEVSRTNGSAEPMDMNVRRVDMNVPEERRTVALRPSIDTPPVTPVIDYAAAARKEKKRDDALLHTPEHSSSKKIVGSTTGPVEKREQESWPSLAAASKPTRKSSKYQHIEQEPDGAWNCTPVRTVPGRKHADESGISNSTMPGTVAKPSGEEGMRIRPQEGSVLKGNPLSTSSSTDSLLDTFSEDHVAWGRQTGKNRKVVWFTKLNSPPRIEQESKTQDFKSQTDDFADESCSTTPVAISPLGLGRGKPLSTRTTGSTTPTCPGPLIRNDDPLGLGINGASCSPIKNETSPPTKCDTAPVSPKDNLCTTPSPLSTHSGTKSTHHTQNAWQVPIKISQTSITPNRPPVTAGASTRPNDKEWPVPSVTLNGASILVAKSSRTPERKGKK